MSGLESADEAGMAVPLRPMAGYRRRLRALLVVALLGSVLAVPNTALAVGGEGEGWPAFGESDGCGSPWMRGPKVEKTGSLSGSTVLRGPHANYFGRTINQVWDSLRWWDVPMSNGERLRMHKRLIPALAEVEVNLAAAAATGLNYTIIDRYTYGYTARTVGGSFRVSQHAFGNAIDMNSTKNPYTTGSLITDMPGWFVDAWSDAGFCWGGYWQSIKDPMHYNWRGPLFTPGFTTLPASYAPLTSAESFTRTMATTNVPGRLDDTTFRILMDGDNDGAIDVVNVNTIGNTTVIDVVRASLGYGGCSVSRYLSPQPAVGSMAFPGDWDRDGAQDLWVVNDTTGLSVTAFTRVSDFEETETVSVAAAAGKQYLSADHNVDGWGDLYIFRYDGGEWTVEVRSGADRFATVLVSGTFAGDENLRFTAVDRNLDQVPDVFAVGANGSLILDGASGFSTSENISVSVQGFDDIAGTDFDGDGRHDLAVLDGNSLKIYAGNSRLSGMQVTSWFEYPLALCSDSGLAYPYEGRFRDDDGSVHSADIDAIADTQVTRGCNPPLNDLFCPRRAITRGELAAFISRGLHLPEGTGNTYVDDDGSTFVGNIESLVAAGILVACNAQGDRFCPSEPVTRDVMAQFLVAAFGFVPSDVDAFVDDGASPYHDDINAIAAVGVTRGCNPPTNDEFCPVRVVTRQEMASFMIRALRISVP